MSASRRSASSRSSCRSTRAKIDKSFVEGLTSDPEDQAIVKAVVDLADSLGLVTVAEGIEAPEQLHILARLGCDRGHGFLLGRPRPAEEARALAA